LWVVFLELAVFREEVVLDAGLFAVAFFAVGFFADGFFAEDSFAGGCVVGDWADVDPAKPRARQALTIKTAALDQLMMRSVRATPLPQPRRNSLMRRKSFMRAWSPSLRSG